MAPILDAMANQDTGLPSPVSRVVAWGWYDGPTEGLLELGQIANVFRFRMLEERRDESGNKEDIRVYGLYPVPADSLDRLVSELGSHQEPRWPIWCPTWQFPTPDMETRINSLVEKIESSAGPLLWVIATDSQFRFIRALDVRNRTPAA